MNDYPDPCACIECDYRGDKPKTLSIHVGLVHAKLDVLLQDKNLVKQRRASYFAKPKKLSIGPNCPVCDQRFSKAQNRDHVSWHFIEELRAIVQEFEDPTQCPQCPYSADTNEKMVKHVALGHSMLDALLQDESLLEHKRMKALSKPKKVNVGSTCPIFAPRFDTVNTKKKTMIVTKWAKQSTDAALSHLQDALELLIGEGSQQL